MSTLAAAPPEASPGETTRTVAVTVPDWPLVAALDRHQRRGEETRRWTWPGTRCC